MTKQEKLAILRERLAMYLEAERVILRGEEYQIGDRRLRRPDLKSVRDAIAELQLELDAEEIKGGRVRRAVFLND